MECAAPKNYRRLMLALGKLVCVIKNKHKPKHKQTNKNKQTKQT